MAEMDPWGRNSLTKKQGRNIGISASMVILSSKNGILPTVILF
jgi:hypothetical protein